MNGEDVEVVDNFNYLGVLFKILGDGANNKH
jgi:hypothetical protein